MSETGEPEAEVPGEAEGKILPVENGERDPVESTQQDPEDVTGGMVPAKLIVPAAESAAHELAHALEDLLSGKFEPIDGVRSRRVELDGAVAIVEVRVSLRNL